MANAFMLTERYCKDLLQQYATVHGGDNFRVRLFQNDYVPVDATDEADLVECDFDGYAMASFFPEDFLAPTWTPYVASMVLSLFVTFTASGSLAVPQIAYGYWVIDGDDNFLWAERWEVPFEFEASSVLNMKPALRQKTCRS